MSSRRNAATLTPADDVQSDTLNADDAQTQTPASDTLNDSQSDSETSAALNDADVQTPADDVQTSAQSDAASEYDNMLTVVPAGANEPAPAPAKPAIKTSEIKRTMSVRMIELLAAIRATLCNFNDDDANERADAFVANYMSYAPAIAKLVTHDASFDAVLDAARSLNVAHDAAFNAALAAIRALNVPATPAPASAE